MRRRDLRERATGNRHWLSEPLLHFLLAGLALFLVHQALSPTAANQDASSRITLTEDDLRQMTIAWHAQGRPLPTPDQMQSLVETKVREEILYREALALELFATLREASSPEPIHPSRGDQA